MKDRPHEDHAEFADLLAALIEEHRPGGMTERHLVEELAATIWRKRRVLLAEGAAINRGLRSVAHSKVDSPIPSAAPFERGLSKDDTDLPDLLTMSPAEVAERQRDAALDLDAANKAGALTPGGRRSWQWSWRGQTVASIVIKPEEGRVILNYTATENGEAQHCAYPVHLDWTPCQLGGERPWFICPARTWIYD